MAKSRIRFPLSAHHSGLFDRVEINPEPYKYVQNAVEYLSEYHDVLLFTIEQNDKPAEVKILKSRLAFVLYQLGRVYYDTESDASLAESALLRAKESVEDLELEPNNIVTAIDVLNMLGLIKAKNDEDNEAALQYLHEAEMLYQTYTCQMQKFGQPTTVKQLFDCSENCVLTAFAKNNPLINARLYTLFYLIYVYGNCDMNTESLICTHLTLKIQLENDYFLQSPLDWALCCAAIAEFFTEQNAYKQARHHLAAASTFVEKLEKQHDHIYDLEVLKRTKADIACSWAKYGFSLLTKSKSRLVEQKKHCRAPVIFDDLLFKNYNVLYEEYVTQYYVTSYKDAQALANNTLMWLNQTKEYYTFEKAASVYAYLCQESCRTYKLLSYYQDNPNKMGKLLKKGIVDLELAVNKLDQENYLPECRQLWYELASVYSDLMDIKYEKHIMNSMVITQHAINKINLYSNTSIKYYTKFIETFYKENNKLPRRLPKFYLVPVLLAHMHMAKCHNKKIVKKKEMKMEIILMCLKYYKAFVDYCEKDPRTAQLIPVELATCKEMVAMIPSKMENLMNTRGSGGFLI